MFTYLVLSDARTAEKKQNILYEIALKSINPTLLTLDCYRLLVDNSSRSTRNLNAD
jgi:hypothetical protein